MRESGFRARFGWALVVLLAAQAVGLGLRQSAGGAATGRWPEPGESLAGVELVDAQGRREPLTTGRPTVLLAFDPACGACQVVAPLWSVWLSAASGTDYRVLAITGAEAREAARFARERGWTVEVLGVRGARARALTDRTPWVFVIDGGGVLLADGQGSRLAELAPTAPAGEEGLR